MALPLLADVDALADWLGRAITSDLDVARAEAVLRAASAQVRTDAATLWVDEEGDLLEDIPDEVPVVVVQLAARLWANPTGATQESAGPFQVTRGSGGLTDDERSLITPTGNIPGLSSVRIAAPAGTRITSTYPDELCDADVDEP